MWESMSGIIAEKKLLLKYQLILFYHVLSCLLCSSLCFHLEGVLRQSGWGLKERRFLKGSSQWIQKMSIITVSTDLESGEKKAHFHLTSSLPFRFHKTITGRQERGCTYSLLDLMELKEGSFKNTMLSLFKWRVISLPSMAGWPQGPLICAVATLGCCLAAWLCDCLIGCPLKAM